MKLTDEQNIRFMNDQRRLEAEKELHKVVLCIQEDVKFNGNAGYYLAVLPPLLKRLNEAYQRLCVVEATVEAEILGIVEPQK